MVIEEEIKEYRKHAASLEVTGNKVRVVTLENYEIVVEVTSEGMFIESSSVQIDAKGFDDMGQLLTAISPAYRDSFSNELMSKLAAFAQDDSEEI